MDSLQALMGGFATALQPDMLIFAFIGCFIGTLVGVLPGVGSAAGMAMLIPVTFAMQPIQAIIMLSAIYYGAMYGGTITSVLVNVPGEASSAITCIEGYEMAKRGRAGAALAIAAIGSFIGATFAIMGLMLVAVPLANIGLRFGPPEMFGLMLVGLSLIAGLSGKSLPRALVSASLGLLVAMVGIDPAAGAPRFVFGRLELMDGFGVVPVVMGLFGIGEIMLNAETGVTRIFDTRMSTLIPTRKDLRDSAWPIARGTGIGFCFGLIPGVGGVISSIASYMAERKLSKTPEKFGTGMIEGVAGPETANNAHHIAHFIPLLSLGIPASASIALILGALMMNGITPGPMLFQEHPDVVWALVASMYIGNVMLLVLNLPLIPMWVAILKIPYSILFALILSFCILGAYSLDNQVFDVLAMLGFGVLGYIFRKLDFPIAPMVVTLILGPMMEKGLRRSLEMSDGDFSIFLNRPISVALLAIAITLILLSAFRFSSSARRADVG